MTAHHPYGGGRRRAFVTSVTAAVLLLAVLVAAPLSVHAVECNATNYACKPWQALTNKDTVCSCCAKVAGGSTTCTAAPTKCVGIEKCAVCSGTVCTMCEAGYSFHPTTKVCTPCAATKCQQCSIANAEQCNICEDAHSIATSYTCVSGAGCGVANCKDCAAGNTTKCASCHDGFSLEGDQCTKLEGNSGSSPIAAITPLLWTALVSALAALLFV